MLEKALGSIFFHIDHLKERCLSQHFQSRFKSCGKNVTIQYPIRILNPDCISAGDNVILFDGSILNTMKKYPWRTDCRYKPELILREGACVFRFCRITVTHRIYIGREVMIADRCYIADSTHDYMKVNESIQKNKLITFEKGIYIDDEAWIGTHCVIIGNIRIGKHSIIGANSVVLQSIPDYCVAVGAPAKIIKRYDRESMVWKKTNPQGKFL